MTGLLCVIKTLVICTDSASNNVKFTELLAQFCRETGFGFSQAHHFRCLAHVINLAVQAAIKHLTTSRPDNSDDLSGSECEPDENECSDVVAKVQ